MQPPFTRERFLQLYPLDSIVQFGEMPPMTLGQAFQMEDRWCRATVEVRADQTRSVARMALALSEAGNLRPEDHNLLNLVPKPGV